ncbi:hypothetical protein KIL84_018942 [Mauremys mutica]|uniref:Uncharacterized protein n=1 Tax=Mauremys mutica TaxID=74926 RepID=A0A9D4B9I9_9SAUR|nr:hypothetical protein KIL84_018942 [Mauremys mutica]
MGGRNLRSIDPKRDLEMIAGNKLDLQKRSRERGDISVILVDMSLPFGWSHKDLLSTVCVSILNHKACNTPEQANILETSHTNSSNNQENMASCSYPYCGYQVSIGIDALF